MAGNDNAPEIRFKGFTDPWEQRKLGDLISSIETGKSVNSTDDLPAEGDVSILKTSCVSSDYFDQTEVKQVVEQERNLVKCPVEADTIIVSRMNTPERVGACGYVASTCPNVYLPDRLWKLTVSNSCDAYLLYTLLASGPRKAQIKGMASGTSGSMHNVPQGPFLELDLLLPQYNEQGKISRYFRNLDSLITLHQRKHEKLVQMKKAMLDKMFPKPGEQFPEIRFKGFTDPWEQRKFADLTEVCSGRDYKHLNEGPIPVYGTGGYMTSVDEALSYDKDAIGIGRKGTIDKPYRLRAPFWTVDTLFYSIPRPGIDIDFALCSFLNVDWKSKDESTGLPSLSKEAINETLVRLPSANEQAVIGRYFAGLDSLITLHQRKCERLKRLKAAMLDKMFV